MEKIEWSVFLEKESEYNWEKRDRIMKIIQKRPIALERIQIDYICQCFLSYRTQLQMNAFNALKRLLETQSMEQYTELLLTQLFRVIAGTKKIASLEAQNCAHIIMESIKPNTRIMTLLSNYTLEKNIDIRTSAVVYLIIFYQQCLETSWLEKSNQIDAFHALSVRVTQDASPHVREKAKLLSRLFDTFHPNFKTGKPPAKREYGRNSAPVTPMDKKLPPLLTNLPLELPNGTKIPIKRNSTPVLPILNNN